MKTNQLLQPETRGDEEKEGKRDRRVTEKEIETVVKSDFIASESLLFISPTIGCCGHGFPAPACVHETSLSEKCTDGTKCSGVTKKERSKRRRDEGRAGGAERL